MAFNIISEIISVWNSGKKGGFRYEGRDEWEDIPAKWDLRKSAHHQPSQNALISSGVDPAAESKRLLDRRVCLACEEQRKEIISLANMGRPSGAGVCCSVLRCIYDCIDVFSEQRQVIPKCTHTLCEDDVAPVITRQPEVSTNAADQVPSNENKTLTPKYEELPEMQEEDVMSTDHQDRSGPAHLADIIFHREKLPTPTHSSSPKSQYASAVDLLEFKEADERAMSGSRFAPEAGESIELQEKAR